MQMELCIMWKIFQLYCIIDNKEYCISSYSCRRNYSFLNLEIMPNLNSCRNISIFYLIHWIFAAKTIQGRKLFKGGNYMRQYGRLKKFHWTSFVIFRKLRLSFRFKHFIHKFFGTQPDSVRNWQHLFHQGYLPFSPLVDKLLCMKNAGTQISMVLI